MLNRIADLDRANRVLTMLSRINRAIVRADSPDALYEEACRIAVESELFKFAWVGLVDSFTGKFRVMASAGGIQSLHAKLTDGVGLAEEVRRTGTLCIYRDLMTPSEGMVCAELLQQGFCSMAGLPLREDGAVIGAFLLFTDKANCFDSTVVNLLDEVADDLSFSLNHMLNEQRRLASEAKLHYLAFYDAQTGMPNRALLEERLPELAARAEQRGTFLTLLDLRLRRLDNVVQLLGAHALDEIMRTLALRLETCRGSDGLLARLAHDEFVLVSLETRGGSDIEMLASQVQQLLEQPVRIGEREVFLHASIGGVMYQLHEHDVAYLLRRARAAADRSFVEGGFRVYHTEIDRGLEQRVAMESELHRALERGEFLLYYQPQLNLKTGAIVGVEALLRWQHPQRGLVSPAHFIPVLEETGLMTKVGTWVLREACRQAKAWQQQGFPSLRMAVNLSAQQFRLVNLVATVRSALEDAQLDAKCLELELTESLILEDAERTIQTMHQLKELGLSLSLDDFGTGYSSLGYLRRYPVDRIKIDQSFVRDMTDHASSAALVRSILAMASNLGLATIAEGVETIGQFGYLRKQLCHEMQGYLYSRPLPPDALQVLLQSGRRLESADALQEGGRTVLVVDDEPAVVSAIGRSLERESWRVMTANDAKSALDTLALHEVGVVISDQRMAGMSGTEFLQRVKEMYPDTVRMLLTGDADFGTVVAAVNRGDVYRVLSKPIDGEALRENVHEAFLRYEAVARHALALQAIAPP